MRRFVAIAVAAFALSIVLFAPEAEAQRRRVVKFTAGAPNPGGGGCHTFGFVRAGLKASYVTKQAGSPDVNYTITYVSDTASQTKTTQVVSTPQGNADAETTIDLETVGANRRGVKHVEVKTTITAPVVGKMTTEVDLDFVPSMVWGPANQWCTGDQWTVPATNVTMTTQTPFAAPVTKTQTTLASTGQVLSVNESVTVPAGTFTTVKYRGVVTTTDQNGNSGTSPAIVWLLKTDPIVVKQDTLDAAGVTVTSTTTLLSMQ